MLGLEGQLAFRDDRPLDVLRRQRLFPAFFLPFQLGLEVGLLDCVAFVFGHWLVPAHVVQRSLLSGGIAMEETSAHKHSMSAPDPRRPNRRTDYVSNAGWKAFDAFKAGITGRRGERAVAEALAAMGAPSLHDVILKDASGTTQIDHIVRGPGAIFVLETKTHGGMIDGALDGYEWEQRFPGGKGAFRFLNPLRQNERHCHAVRAVLHGLPVEVAGILIAAGTASYTAALTPAITAIRDLRHVLFSRKPVGDAINEAWGRLTNAASIGETYRDQHQQQFSDTP